MKPLASAENEGCYESMISAMAEGVVLQDASGAVLACNASAERLLGLTPDQLVGLTAPGERWRAIHADGSPFLLERHPALATLRSGVPERNVEMGVHKPDGTLTWVSINTQPLYREADAAPYAVVATYSDITERKRAEAELQRSEERYRRIVETSLEGVWTIDLEGRTTYANARMARMLRCTPDELAEAALWDFVDPSDRSLAERQLQRRGQGVGEEHEFQFRAKDGSRVWSSLAACPITLPDGRPGALAMVRDITEQKQLFDQLQEARRMEAIGRLAGGVAHDFNNMLTAILSSVALAEREPSELHVHLESIRVASERAAGFTKQLLAFARKQRIRLRPLQVSDVLCELAAVLPRVVGERIEVVLDTAETWPVLGDRSQLEQVLLNLVANARDAMPGGGRVTLRTRDVTLDREQLKGSDVQPGDYVVLSVHDTGRGIDDDARQHIFEPFFTTKTHGTGLGLASCYGIAKQLGGHVWVTSTSHSGTTFEVYLPRSAELPALRTPPPRAASEAGDETILIAEDNELVRNTLARALGDAGYRVLVAADGEAALELATTYAGRIHLVVTDVVMPKLSGRELAERLAAVRPELQVLFVSGYLDEIVLPDAGEAPLQFLAKPYSLPTMLRAVRARLDRRGE